MGCSRGAVRTVPGPTGTALITVDAQGANTIVVISGANSACDAALVDRALAGAEAPGILLLQHEIPEEAERTRDPRGTRGGLVHRAQSGARAAGDAGLLPLIDLIAPNETEAAALTGSSDPRAAARHLLAHGVRAALITLGGAGALYCDARDGLHCAAVAVQPVDTTAAGDAYIGALAAALSEDRTVADSLGFAAAAAGLAVTRLGAQPSLGSRDEVAAFISRFGAPRPEALAV